MIQDYNPGNKNLQGVIKSWYRYRMEHCADIKKNQEINSKCVFNILLKARRKGWTDDSSVNSTKFSYIGPGFNSQNPQGITQSVIPVTYHTEIHSSKYPHK